MSWEAYYDKLGKIEKPRLFYLDAIKQVSSNQNSLAIDFGCGIGVEVEDLVRRNFHVHAYDQSEKAIELSKKRIPSQFQNRIHFYNVSFEEVDQLIPVEFFHSFHALPFCKKDSFLNVVQKTIDCVKIGGIYGVTFFGNEDQWCIEGKCISMTIPVIKNLLAHFEILHLKELKAMGGTALGDEKMWHVIEVIAKRKEEAVKY